MDDVAGIAEYTGLSTEELEEWERAGRVPRKHAAQVKWARWAVRRDAALASSGLPACEAVRPLQEATTEADLKALMAHLESCETCLARSRYVDEHVGPMPPVVGGLLFRAMGLLDRLSGWQRSALAGSLLLLAIAGLGVLVLLGFAILRRDLAYVTFAGALFALLVGSGAAGGVVHHATAPLRTRGTIGYYASAILTVYGYLASIVVMIALAGLVLGWETLDPEMAELVLDPVGWIAFAMAGAVFGVVFGRAMRGTDERGGRP